MADLFDDGTQPSTPEKDELRFDWLNLFAHEKLGEPAEWRWFLWQRKNFDKPSEFMLLTGAVCAATIERGKRKGQTDWKKRDKSTEAMHAIKRTELEAFQREWSERTGKCSECYGTGEAWCGWGVKTGHRYKPCPRCNATGAFRAEAA